MLLFNIMFLDMYISSHIFFFFLLCTDDSWNEEGAFEPPERSDNYQARGTAGNERKTAQYQ